MKRLLLLWCCVWALCLCPQASAQTQIQFWHSMPGALGDKVNDFAQRFNASQTEFKVVPAFKGHYQESMTAAIAAYRAGKAPNIVQVYDIATATMMTAKGAVKPVHELMKEAGLAFDANTYLAPIAGYYSDRDGKLMSLPFNASTNVLYLNHAALKKAGIDASKPMTTWKDFIAAAEKLKASGHSCPFTSNCPSCVHIENLSVWHNVPIATRDNGMAGWDAQLQINGPLQLRHLTMLADFAKRGIFSYSGRLAEGEARFYSGECAMLTGSSSAIANIRRAAKFEYSIRPLPYYDDVPGAPQNMLVSGASLWALGGKSAAEYKGVAKFFAFLSQPAIQAEWHETTGYMPVSAAAYALAKSSGYYGKNPGADVPYLSLTHKPPTAQTRGVRFGNYIEVRRTIDEELEQVFAGKKAPKAALDEAVARGDEILKRFAGTVRE